jgi:molecular chaperone GrpE
MADYQDRKPEPSEVSPSRVKDAETRVPEETLPQGEMPYRPAADALGALEDAGERIDRLVRALADAENARRRAERTAAEARQYAIGDFARDLLAVADNLERALAVADAGGPGVGKAVVEGVRITEQLLKSVAERYGVTKMESLGQAFDPKLHEAVMVVEDPSREPGTIVDVVEEGYMLHDRLLRPARVFVNNPNLKPATDLRGTEPG